MLRHDNYVSFAVVVGFFVGVIFGIAKFDDPELMILWTIMSTAGIFLIVTLSAAVCYWFIDSNEMKVQKERLEESLEYYRKEFDEKDKEVQSIRNFIRSLDSTS